MNSYTVQKENAVVNSDRINLDHHIKCLPWTKKLEFGSTFVNSNWN